jgi:hypothetical protein
VNKVSNKLHLDHFASKLIRYQTVLWVFVVLGIAIHGYMGNTWTEVQSFKVNDGWCEIGIQGIGNHCFGDFGLPYFRGLRDSTYLPDNFAAANTPVTAALFEFLRLIPYNWALGAYLLMLASCVCIPFLWKTEIGPLSVRLQLAGLCGLLTSGGISALDRGNHVLMLIPLLFFFVQSIENEKWARAAVYLTAIALLKFWGIIFIIALIARGKWLLAALASTATGVISLVTIAFFPGSVLNSVGSMISMVTNRGYSNSISGFSISLPGFIRRAGCAISSPEFCNTKAYGSSALASPLIGVSILLMIALLAMSLMRLKKAPTLIWASVLVSMGYLAIPDAPVYNLSLTVVIVAIAVGHNATENDENWKFSQRALLLALLITNTPLNLYSTSVNRLASTSGDGPLLFRSDYWIIPMVWIVFLSVVIYELFFLIKNQRD